MELTESLMLFLEEQEEKQFVPTLPDGEAITEEIIQERFKIQSVDQANYYIRKYKEIELSEAEIRETAKRQIERMQENIKLWEEQEIKKLEYPKMFFKELLRAYAEEKLSDSNKKSLSLPNGKISFRKQQDEYHYDDEMLKKQLLHTKYSKQEVQVKIDKVSLKKDLSVVDGKAYLDGTLVEGIEVATKAPKFEIK